MDLQFIQKFIKKRSNASVAALDENEIPFSCTLYPPWVMEGSSLYFAVRNTPAATDYFRTTPLVYMTFTRKMTDPATLKIKGHITVCTDTAIVNRFLAQVPGMVYGNYSIFKLTCISADWSGRRSQGAYFF